MIALGLALEIALGIVLVTGMGLGNLGGFSAKLYFLPMPMGMGLFFQDADESY